MGLLIEIYKYNWMLSLFCELDDGNLKTRVRRMPCSATSHLGLHCLLMS